MIGIYLLTFGNSLYYVGASKNIPCRYEQHIRDLRAGKHIVKIQDAFNTFGDPKLEILEECNESDLYEKEKFYINKYNSYFLGLNSTRGGYRGGGDIFSDESIDETKKILESYILNKNTLLVAKICGLDASTVRCVLSKHTRTQLRECYPELYDKATELYSTIRSTAPTVCPKVVCPKGIVYTIPYRGAASFAKTHNIHYCTFTKLLNGKVKTCNGWRLYKELP